MSNLKPVRQQFRFGNKNIDTAKKGTGLVQHGPRVNPNGNENEESLLSEAEQQNITKLVMDRINPEQINMGNDDNDDSENIKNDLIRRIEPLIANIINEQGIQANEREQQRLAKNIVYDMMGLGPLEELRNREDITDIMVNGCNKVFAEVGGRSILMPIKFRNEEHLRTIAGRIASQMNRQLDEAHPLLDARLKDGSRVNVVIPPVAIDGTSVSIRKFSKDALTLEKLVSPPPGREPALSQKMLQWLAMAARCRLNIIISGGTSTGKTTMLNAISRYIENHERIITIEDAAELRLQQPHVVRLETRRNTNKGDSMGEDIDQGRLVQNALRMRPERIILGEVRAGEAFDLLQAMNTGHDGSFATLHANNPREALSRLENLVLMSGYDLPSRVIRSQIQSAVDMIIQIHRLPDGSRRIVDISEIAGMEGDTITVQQLFRFDTFDMRGGKVFGEFVMTGSQPSKTREKLKNYGLDDEARKIFLE